MKAKNPPDAAEAFPAAGEKAALGSTPVSYRIHMLRREKKLTQSELAARLGVSDKTVSKWEHGGMPCEEIRKQLAFALDTSTDTLFDNMARSCDGPGAMIRTLRKKHKLTQSALAALLNISDKSVSKWERGASAPTTDMLPKLCALLSVPPEALIRGMPVRDIGEAAGRNTEKSLSLHGPCNLIVTDSTGPGNTSTNTHTASPDATSKKQTAGNIRPYKLAIFTPDDSDLSELLVSFCPDTDVFHNINEPELDLSVYDIFAFFGGTQPEAMSLLPPVRNRIDEQIRQGKRVFAEYIYGIGSVSFLAPPQCTRFDPPVLSELTEFVPGVDAGSIFYDQCNNHICAYKALNRTRPILYYQNKPMGYYKIPDSAGQSIPLSRFAFWEEADNLLISGFRMANYARACFSPSSVWKKLIAGIVTWLLDGDINMRQRCETAVVSKLRGYNRPAGKQTLDETVCHALNWFEKSGCIQNYNGAPYAVYEGFSASIHADGTHDRVSTVRTDCTGATALSYLLAYRRYGDSAYTRISEGLYRMPRDMMIRDDCPHRGMVRNATDWWWNVNYQDDTARGFLFPYLWKCFITGDRTMLPDVVTALEYLLKTTGTDGLRVIRVDFYDLQKDEIQAVGMEQYPENEGKGNHKWRWGGGSTGNFTVKALSARPSSTPSAHYNAYYLGALLFAYRLTGDRRYYDTGVRGLTTLMSYYPNTAREHSQTQELCRMVLPLSLLYWVTGRTEHRDWLYRIVRDLQQFRHEEGAYLEWDSGYQAACARSHDGETTVFFENGDPVTDLLYSLNWLPAGFITAYYVTGDRWFYQLWAEISDFFSRIQLRSDNPSHNGAWTRSFDVNLMEVYGCQNDVGWAPWSIESGWSVAETVNGILLGLNNDIGKLFRQPYPAANTIKE